MPLKVKFKVLKHLSLQLLTALVILLPSYAEVLEYNLEIQGHKFTPEVLKLPKDTRIKLNVLNRDPSAEEFESNSLNIEKIIPGNGKGSVFIGPLDPGKYEFFGEFNIKTAVGEIIVE